MSPAGRTCLLVLALLGGSAAAQDSRLLDDFGEAAPWRAAASDGVGVSSRPFDGGLRLDYDFTKGSGYAFLRRELPLELPENFELRFRLRGGGAANALEIKLVDPSGDDVWWHRKPDYVPPGQWTTLRVKRRQIDFAWGPTQDRTLRRTAAIEFVVAAGSGGGKGWIAVDDLTIVPLPVPPIVPPTPIVSGGIGEPLLLDLAYIREFGGLRLAWTRGAHAADYAVQFSDDRQNWRTVREVRGSDGGIDWIKLEESEARFVRIVPTAGRRFRLEKAEVQPIALGASDNAFVAAVAREARRGLYPRGFVGEQNYWTLVATPDGGNSGLMDESGAIEIGRGGFSVEPFVLDGGTLVGWSDVETENSLLDNVLPIPSVTWRRPGWSLVTTAYADAKQGGYLVGRHTLRNDGAAPRDLTLVLAVRPFQVNPLQQFLNIRGGVSPITRLDGDEDVLQINGDLALRMHEDADQVAMSTFASGPPIARSGSSGRAIVDDPTGLATASYLYRIRLAPGESRTVSWEAPLSDRLSRAGYRAASVDEAAQRWRQALGDVSITGPVAAAPLFDTLRTALAHVLATREGPALRPGSRSYARSWIRDGTMMSTALLRMGLPEPADRYLRWYAPFQYENGKVPCCVDSRGADPVPEHDSHGQLIHLVAELHRYAPDAARLAEMWPRVRAAADHIETLRQTTRTEENRRELALRPRYGLLPPSISHEGYSSKPAYSYWDNFWALTGLKDAAWLAAKLGRPEEARLLETRIDAYRTDLVASIAATRAVFSNRYIPGAADLGDFDPTSTTIGLSLGGEERWLPQSMVRATFERYWQESLARRDGAREWKDYTPYEWRNVGAMVRLGWRDRALAMADFFMADRRPAGWNQWAEVVGRKPREPRFIGDMPHGWVASDFINAVLDMLAFERFEDDALVLGAGIPRAWLEGGGIRVERLRTPYGPLSYTLRAEGGRGILSYRLEGTPPPGGLVLHWMRGDIGLTGASGRRAFVL
jgi:hypothetical protein